MNRPGILYEKREVETEPLTRKIMVHMAMHYKCEVCGNVYKFWLEKGLEDRKQDEINPEMHKPVPYAIPCLCGGTATHFAWGNDEELEDYRPLEQNENYFENSEKCDCGISHFRNSGYKAQSQEPEFPDLSEIMNIFENKTTERSNAKEDEDFEDNPYGLAHISTTTLKAELRRRKKSWNRRAKE